MHANRFWRLWPILVVLVAGCTKHDTAVSQATTTAPPKPPVEQVAAKPAASESKTIYDESADGFEQIATALATAKSANKRVLLQFGAEWCGWCHKLHRLCASDDEIAHMLDANYVVALIDVNKGHNKDIDEKYGHPTQHGLPVIVVLDADGGQLTTKDTAELEEGDHHDPAKVLAFLNEWSPASALAETAPPTDAPAAAETLADPAS